MAKKKKKASRANKTGDLGLSGPGVDVPKIAAIDKAIANYVPARNARMEASKHEKETKNKLLDAVHENADKLGRDPKSGVLTYKTDEMVLTLTPVEKKLKVKAVGGVDEEGEE